MCWELLHLKFVMFLYWYWKCVEHLNLYIYSCLGIVKCWRYEDWQKNCGQVLISLHEASLFLISHCLEYSVNLKLNCEYEFVLCVLFYFAFSEFAIFFRVSRFLCQSSRKQTKEWNDHTLTLQMYQKLRLSELMQNNS